MVQAGIDTSTTTPYTLHPADYHYATTVPYVLFWMTIVEQLSLGRVCQEEGERNGVASWSRRGTDPALLPRFRMTYTTRPSQDLLDQ
uniref:Transposase n=1 Tax=Heterorhabditis bacteriophora TaxID=37862 RepID=A0A1I7WBV2_HETBA